MYSAFDTQDDRLGKTYRSGQKRESLLLHGVFVYNKPELNFMHSSNHTGHCRNNCTISHAQNTTALQPNVMLIGIHWLLVTNTGQSAFPGANNCQDQLQTQQWESAHAVEPLVFQTSIFEFWVGVRKFRRYKRLFIYFFLSPTPFYPSVLGVEGYCFHMVTHSATHAVCSTPLDGWSVLRRGL